MSIISTFLALFAQLAEFQQLLNALSAILALFGIVL